MYIGILTCQWTYNYGAVLQAYALSAYLSGCGHKTKLINYQPAYRRGVPEDGYKKILKPVIRFPDWIAGYTVFNTFLKQKTPLSVKQSVNLQELKQNENDCDVYIVGSDQVWAFHLPNAYDDALFLDFAPEGARRISYAASIANTHLSADKRARLSNKLTHFDAISVREKSAKSLLETCGILDVSVTIDPVFLLSSEQWSQTLTKNNEPIDEKYVLVYCFTRPRNIYEYARKLADSRGYKLYCVGTFWEDRFFSGADKTYWNCTPEKFVALVANAQCVVTNSFHGVAFSIIYQKEFHAFTKQEPEDTRLLDLLEEFDLGGCIVTGNEPKEVYAVANQDNLARRISFSKRFLCQSLTQKGEG